MDRRIEKRRWTPKKILLYVGLPLIVLLGLGMLMKNAGVNRYRVDKERLSIGTVASGEFEETIPINGRVMALKTVFVTAVEGGQVEKLYLEGGEMVSQGDLILKLSNPSLEMNYMNLQTNLLEQADQLRNTRISMENTGLQLKDQLIESNYQIQDLGQQYERSKVLFADSVISEADFQTVENNYLFQVRRKKLLIERIERDSLLRSQQIGQVETSLSLVGRNLTAIQRNLDNLTVKAPVAGLLSSVPAEIGQTVQQGEKLGQIDIMGGYKVRANIDEHFISKVENGLRGTFTFDGEAHDLHIIKIYPEVNQGSFEVDLAFDGSAPEGIKRGQNLQIRLALSDQSKAILVPRGGFYTSTGGKYMFVVTEGGESAVKREVSFGRQSDRFYEVKSGLEPGERVITSSYDLYLRADELILND
ncbi:MAG: HlyD family efflux transporter periplasmic adaptor subunit [Bacteroidota bacterium]